MTAKLKEVLTRAKTWPKKVQDQALQALLIIEARHTQTYRLSADEWDDIQESIGQADRGELVPEEIRRERSPSAKLSLTTTASETRE